MADLDGVVRALMAERYGPVVREWHGVYGVPTDYAEVVRRRTEAAEVADEQVLSEGETA